MIDIRNTEYFQAKKLDLVGYNMEDNIENDHLYKLSIYLYYVDAC